MVTISLEEGTPKMQNTEMQPLNSEQEMENAENVKNEYKYDLVTFYTSGINGVLAIMIVVISFLRTDIFTMHMIDMEQRCGDPDYNQMLKIKESLTETNIILCLTCLIVLSISSIKFLFGNTAGGNWKKLGHNLMIFITNVIALSYLVHLMQSTLGMPYPYFFKIEELRMLFCESVVKRMSPELNQLNYHYRKSFPSYPAAIESFCLIFLILYLDHFHSAVGVRSSQLTIMLLLGTKVVHNTYYAIENNQHHIMDVVGGAIFGIIFAMFTVRNMFGRVLAIQQQP